MNWLQLKVFTENLSKMLDDGVIFSRAFEVASRSMTSRKNREFASTLGASFVEGLDVRQQLASYNVPSFYLAILKCGQLTGRLPEALKAASFFLNQIIPLKLCMKHCVRFSILAYMISAVIIWFFSNRLNIIILALLALIFVLPVYIGRLKYYRDYCLAKIPFLSTWSKQLALLEFFLCIEISYDSPLSAKEMFDHSIRAVGNGFLRKQMALSLRSIEKRNSFSDSLALVPFIPQGMTSGINVAEISGTMDRTFHSISSELKKIIEAKLEPVKALAMYISINFGLLAPLIAIVPIFVRDPGVAILAIGTMMGFLLIACVRYAFEEYSRKAADVNLWWQQLQ